MPFPARPCYGRVAMAVFVLLILSVPSADAESGKRADRLINFKMTDQFDRSYDQDKYAGFVTILTGSDKKGSSFNALWVNAIFDSIVARGVDMDRIWFLGTADLRGVPRFMKGFVKGKFPKEEERWALLDWEGKFAKAYHWKPGATNIEIFGPDGMVAASTYGRNVSPSRVAGLAKVILELAGSAQVAGIPEESP